MKINSHNKEFLSDNEETLPISPNCNCNNLQQCPMQGNCLAEGIVYIAKISSDIPHYKEKEYKGICNTTFKIRFGNHKKEFNNVRYRNSTKLSQEMWKLKEQDVLPKIKWSIFGKFRPYNTVSKRCYLCLNAGDRNTQWRQSSE